MNSCAASTRCAADCRWKASSRKRPNRSRSPAEAGQHQSPVALARFARQRSGLILLGFVLTVATTTVGLIPYYLTVP